MAIKRAAMALCEDTVSIADEKLKEEEKLAIILGTEGEDLLPQTINKVITPSKYRWHMALIR